MHRGVQIVEEGFEDVFQEMGLPKQKSPPTPQSRSLGHLSWPDSPKSSWVH